ncbi:DUF7344 domain-containing protein [Halovenus marina]|uniref:DUF7344 domain-containing protein n=1 Tax=Halovenus marina TaxID=3396621 RepID=UPI003F54822C
MAEAIEQQETERTDASTGRDRLSKAHVFELLSAQRRQEVLRYLEANGGTATLGEVAEYIAGLECEVDPAQLNSQQRKRVYVGLYQCHLPKMADAGVIDYDQSRGDIELNERSARLLKYLYLEEHKSETPQSGLLGRLFG